jgi:hopanoid biosynthesis associated protein HpnK
MKQLIVNADDFGMTGGVNRAVGEAHCGGIVTSTTLMATGGACDEAIALARSLPSLSVGAHIVLLGGTPLLAPEVLPSLAFRGPGGGPQFRRGFGAFCSAALAGRIASGDVYRETTAQIESLAARGLRLSHLDTHMHAHAFPAVFRPLLQAAADCGVPAVRNPYEPAVAMPRLVLLARPRLWDRHLPVTMLRLFAAEFHRCCRYFGLTTTDGLFGVTLTGYVDQPSFLDLLRRVPDGTWELLCHPAHEDEAWWSLGTRRGAGAAELRVLTSAATLEAVAACGIARVPYGKVREAPAVAAA